MTDKFNSISEAYKFYATQLVDAMSIESKNEKNKDTYKKEIKEIHPVFFELENSQAVIPNFKNHKIQPYWSTLEIISEMLSINPPLMANYRKDLVAWSYDLQESGRACYLYGQRWANHNSLEKTIDRLVKNPTSKRLYVPIFDQNDVGDTADAPCNLGFLLLSRDNKLDLTLFTRSIDINRGFKYDPVLFSFIQQSLASITNQEPGKLFYYCNSLHSYTQDLETLQKSLESINTQNGKDILLKVDKGMTTSKLYDDLREVVEIDTLLRAQSPVVKEKIDKLNYSITRDFARILGVKNKMINAEELENEDYKLWVNNKK